MEDSTNSKQVSFLDIPFTVPVTKKVEDSDSLHYEYAKAKSKSMCQSIAEYRN